MAKQIAVWIFMSLGLVAATGACGGSATTTTATTSCAGGAGPVLVATGGAPNGGESANTAGAAGTITEAGAASERSDAGAAGASEVYLPRIHATNRIFVRANLDQTDVVPTAAFDPTDPANTSNFSTTIPAFGEGGDSHTLNLYFAKTADNTWDYHLLADGSELAPLAQGNVEVGTGTLNFRPNGALDSVSIYALASVRFEDDSSSQAIDLDFGESLANGGTGFDGVTQSAVPANVTLETQDGFGRGQGVLGSPCNVDLDCEANSCVQHTCFCGEGCRCKKNTDCSNDHDVCSLGVCRYGG